MSEEIPRQSKVQAILKQQETRNKSFVFSSVGEVSKLRVTTAQEIESCPKKWSSTLAGKTSFSDPSKELEDTEKGAKGKKFALIGTLVHLYVEENLRAFFTGTQPDDELVSEILDLFFAESPQESLNLARYVARIKKTLSSYELLALEQEVQIPVDLPLPIYGQIDAIFKHKTDKSILILDHKTNRKPDRASDWKKKLQVVSYSAAVCRIYDIPKVSFIIGKVNLTEDLPFEIEDPFESVQRRYANIYEAIMKNPNRTIPGDETCRYCKIRGECPHLIRIQDYCAGGRPWIKS